MDEAASEYSDHKKEPRTHDRIIADWIIAERVAGGGWLAIHRWSSTSPKKDRTMSGRDGEAAS